MYFLMPINAITMVTRVRQMLAAYPSAFHVDLHCATCRNIGL